MSARDTNDIPGSSPRSQEKDENLAIQRILDAAETSMQQLKIAHDPNEKARLSRRVKALLDDAEKLKHRSKWTSAPLAGPAQASAAPQQGGVEPTSSKSSSRVLKEPFSSRISTKAEQILLLKASFLNNFKFPPWSEPPDPSEFELREGEEAFTDTQDLPLSEFQEDVLDAWKRPRDALPPPGWSSPGTDSLQPAMTFDKKIDLVQDAATDCSVVASMCAGVARVEKGHSKIIRKVMHPYDSVADLPMMSRNGKYIACLNFNGCYRKVVIDDRLPTSSTSRVIHVLDRNNPALLWPLLIEKAYLKVRGGYDFPGSNSGTDLWILTGWIPEQIFLQSDELEPDRFWTRISKAFEFGDVLITMGTGKMTLKTERELGLAGEHDYAVIDLKELDGQRLFLVKNPWCEGTSWRGKLTGVERTLSSSEQTVQDADRVGMTNDELPVQSSRDLLNADKQLSPGTFWMDLDNVMQYFESIYLNWNPGLFTYRQDIHFAWDLSPPGTGTYPRGPYASLSRYPQYTASVEKGGILWMLLSRHFRNAVPADATTEEIEADRYDVELSGHMSLIAFSSNGYRVLLPEKYMVKGWYVDSPQTLLRLDCQPGEVVTVVPAEQELPAAKHTFTLSAFSNSPLTLTEARKPYLFETTSSSSWTKDNAGGNAHSLAYITNPQFSISISQKTNISLLLEATDEVLNIHVKLLHSQGRRMHSIRNRDIVFDSGDYRRGSCVAEHAELEAGQYTIICSTFEPRQLGDFTLLVQSSQPTQVRLLPRDGAGRFRQGLSPVTFPQGQNKVATPLTIQKLVNLYAIAQYLDLEQSRGSGQRSTSTHTLVRMSIELGRGADSRTLVISNEGEYSNSASGVRTEALDLRPDMWRFGEVWLVLERMYVSSEARMESYAVELFADQPAAVVGGAWQGWDD